MKRAGLSFFCCCFAPFFYQVIHPVAGKPLQSSSHDKVFAVAHHYVSLPCRLATPVDLSHARTLEWSRVDTSPESTVHVVRSGKELVKEKKAEYVGRTAVMDNGSLILSDVKWGDNGTYRCDVNGGKERVTVSLIVAEVSEVNAIVHQTSYGERFVGCESGGWRPQPLISILDARGNILDAETHSSVSPDNLYSVKAHVDMAAAGGNETLICRVEITGTSLVKEIKIHTIADYFNTPKAGLSSQWLISCVLAVVAVVAIVAFLIAVFIMKKKKMLQRLTDYCQAAFYNRRAPEGREHEDEGHLLGDHRYTVYGDINKVDTTGASEDTRKANQLLSTGVEASNRLAERNLEEMLKYKDDINSVGETLHIQPALIAAIISRQSQAGTKLRPDGYGQTDHNCYGLMQINKSYHAVKGNPHSREHIDQGVTFFIQLIKTMERTKRDWSKEQQLKGALACYIAGEDQVIPLERYEEVDSVTPYCDFANDVVARAQWFARNGF